MKLDLGCGNKKLSKEYIGIDNRTDADIKWDLENALPPSIKDNSVDEIVMRHSIEHIWNVWKLLDDIYKALKPKGKLRIWTPHYSSWGAFSTMNHKKFFSVKTFDHLQPNSNQNPYCKAKFKILKKKLHYIAKGNEIGKSDMGLYLLSLLNNIITSIVNINQTFYEQFLSGLIPCYEIYFELEKVL